MADLAGPVPVPAQLTAVVREPSSVVEPASASEPCRNLRSLPPDLTIRRGTPDDAAAVRALGEAVVPPTYSPFGQEYVDLMLREWWAVDRMAASLEAIPHWVAEDDDGRVVGVANLGEHVVDGAAEPTMWKLYVHPEHHGVGLGSRLLAEVLAANGDRPLLLEVVDGNESAEAFYRRHGFVEVRRTPERVFPEVTLIWMRRDA